jgi:quercetin dioxygenase-like cupin family protein
MENKYNESTPLRPEGDRVVDAPLVSIDLPSFMKQIKQEATWKNSDRNAITIFKSKGMRIVLIALHAGAVMNAHKGIGILSVQVLEGHMTFATSLQTTELHKGQMLSLHEGIPHSLTAIEETTVLLTLALCN